MAIIWNKLIPRWDGLTIEPPEAKKDVGYIAGDKPPAKWENWLRKGTYEALDETRDVIESIDLQMAQKVSNAGDTMTGNLNVPTINSKTPAYAISPTETVITSGFASGWSGTLKYAKTQDNKIIVKIIYMQKTSDISSSGETIYTIPHVPVDAKIELAIGANVSNDLIAGSIVAVSIDTLGKITLTNKGSVTAGVRTLYSSGVEAY